ncbi:HAD family hydrolase [Actinosynnema sp. CA-248983]
MRAVIFDWRGTLVLTPTFRGWVTEALRRLGRDTSTAADIVAAIDVERLDAPGVDADATLHRETYYNAFTAAALDPHLADALYEVEADATFNPFAADAAPTLKTLHDNGIRIGILSDIHFDIRPAFDGLPVDSFVLSFEHGAVKPDPAIFRIALAELGTSPRTRSWSATGPRTTARPCTSACPPSSCPHCGASTTHDSTSSRI